jgi:hypothetical protein
VTSSTGCIDLTYHLALPTHGIVVPTKFCLVWMRRCVVPTVDVVRLVWQIDDYAFFNDVR